MIKHITKHIIRSVALNCFPLRITTGIYITLVRPAYQMATKMIKHVIKHIIRSIALNDFPLCLTTGLCSILVSSAYQMAFKMIKHIIKHIISSITLKSIIPKLLEKLNIMKNSKHDQNIHFVTYQINQNSSKPREHK